MAGIYLHIPFCKKACHYCDFHFSTSSASREQMIAAIARELILQKNFLNQETIETIYFGGGTPSLLTADELKLIINLIYENYTTGNSLEITLEANPDDLSPQKVRELKETDINRFSIGIQSFYEEDLFWMNRAHNSREAEGAVKRVQDAGFENITVDLIYGFPLLSDEKWISNIHKVVEFAVPHISAYSMTVEPATALASFIKKGIQLPMNESQSAGQFFILMEHLQQAEFEHYEISNFAKSGCQSRHNSNYWNGVPYLGVGPSAHSFRENSRQWNIANNTKYINSITAGKIPCETETLSPTNRLNEYIMTSLRTAKGMDLQKIESTSDHLPSVLDILPKFFEKNWIQQKDQVVTLTADGKLYADQVAAELFAE